MSVSRRKHVSHRKKGKSSHSNVLLIVFVVAVMSVLLSLDVKVAMTMRWPLNVMMLMGPVILIGIFLKPISGIILLIILLYLDALQRVPGTQFTAVKIVFAITAFSSIIVFLMKKTNKPRTPMDLPIIFYGIALFSTMFFGHSDYFHISIILRVATFIIIVMLMSTLIKDEKSLRTILYIMIFGALLSASLGLVQYAVKGNIVTMVYPDRGYTGDPAAGYTAQYGGRSTGLTPNANHFAFMLMIVVPFLFAIPHTFKMEKESLIAKLLLSITLYIICGSIVLSQSRAALIGTGLILIFMTILAPPKYKIRYGVLYLLLPLLISLFVLFGMGLYTRNAIEDDPSVSVRLNDNLIVRDILLDRPSLLIEGAGFSGYARIAPPYQIKYGFERLPVLHSDYLRTLFEFGLLSFMALMAVWITAFYSSYKGYKNAPEDKKYMILAFSMSMMSIVIFIFFHTEMFGPGSWYIIGLYSAAYSIYYGNTARSITSISNTTG